MARMVTAHRLGNPLEQLDIEVLDEPGPGGANHAYLVEPPDKTWKLGVKFQSGAVATNGHNGVTQEALIGLCIDRLSSFQKGPCPCYENHMALTKLHEALMWLNKRTHGRVENGTEGKQVK